MGAGTPVVGTLIEQGIGSGSTLAVPYPSTAVGDLLILIVVSKAIVQATPPAGYTSISSFSNTGSTLAPGLMVAVKAATGSETGNLSVTVQSNISTAGQIWAVSGMDLTQFLNVAVSTTDQTTASTQTVMSAITTGSDGALLMTVGALNSASGTATPPSGFTETADRVSGVFAFEFAYMIQTSAGNTGSETIAWSGNAKSVGVLAAFNPRVTPTNGTITWTANNATVSSPSVANAQPATDVAFTANDAAAGSNKPRPDTPEVQWTANDAHAGISQTQITVTDPAHTQIIPGLAIRVRAVWNGVAYPLWRGNVDNWGLSFFQPTASVANVQATDGTKWLSRFDRPGVTKALRPVSGGSPEGAGEDTGARVDRVLDSAGWPPTDRLIDVGDSTLQATDLAGDAWSELLTAVGSEAGDIFLDTSGRVVFRRRRSVLHPPFTDPVAIFGDQVVAQNNYETNASMESGISGWSAGGSVPPTLQWTTEQAFDGTHSLKVIWGTGGSFPLVASAPNGLVTGATYTASRYVYVPSGNPDVGMAVGGIGFGTSTSVKDSWVRITQTFVAPASLPPSVQIWPQTSPTAGQFFYVDAAQTEDGPVANAYVPNSIPAELPVYDIETVYDDDLLYNLIGATNNSPPTESVDLIVGGCTGVEGQHTITCSSTGGIPIGAHVAAFAGTTVIQISSGTIFVVEDAHARNFGPQSLTVSYDVTPAPGLRQEVRDNASIQVYGPRPFETSGLILQNDTDALDYAGYVLHLTKTPGVRIASITVRPRRNPNALWPVVLSLGYGDRIRVNFTPPGGGARVSQESFIRGISHETNPQGFWETKYQLQDATQFSTFWTIGDPDLGRIGRYSIAF